MLRGNLVGYAMFVVSALTILITKLVLKLDDGATMVVVGITLIVLNLILRLRNRQRQGWLTQRQFGGYLLFVPIWVLGIVVIAANAVRMVTQ